MEDMGNISEPSCVPLWGHPATNRTPQQVKEVNLIDAPVADKTSRKLVAIG